MWAYPGKKRGESPLDLPAPLSPPLAAPFPLRASEDGPPDANNLWPLAAGALAAEPAEEEGKAKGDEDPDHQKACKSRVSLLYCTERVLTRVVARRTELRELLWLRLRTLRIRRRMSS